jgi:membrane protease YdiL (CAAX protease family)
MFAPGNREDPSEERASNMSGLLPKMEGVFGRWDWVANALLFGFYHLHQPWSIPGGCITGLVYTYPARRLRSAWMSIILHSAQSVFFLFLMLGLVLRLA